MDKKVLIVDDEEVIRNVLNKGFGRSGYEAFLAASGPEALDILARESIQVMFLDLMLPGMNGVELCRQIREDNPIACIFALTAYNSLFEVARCREVGFDDYFTKPVDIDILIAAADEALSKLDRWTTP